MTKASTENNLIRADFVCVAAAHKVFQPNANATRKKTGIESEIANGDIICLLYLRCELHHI